MLEWHEIGIQHENAIFPEIVAHKLSRNLNELNLIDSTITYDEYIQISMTLLKYYDDYLIYLLLSILNLIIFSIIL